MALPAHHRLHLSTAVDPLRSPTARVARRSHVSAIPYLAGPISRRSHIAQVPHRAGSTFRRPHVTQVPRCVGSTFAAHSIADSHHVAHRGLPRYDPDLATTVRGRPSRLPLAHRACRGPTATYRVPTAATRGPIAAYHAQCRRTSGPMSNIPSSGDCPHQWRLSPSVASVPISVVNTPSRSKSVAEKLEAARRAASSGCLTDLGDRLTPIVPVWCLPQSWHRFKAHFRSRLERAR